VQNPIYGDEIANAMRGLPGKMGEDVPRFLTESLFGDFHTRKGLDLKTRGTAFSEYIGNIRC
jgi:hypothetical protein